MARGAKFSEAETLRDFLDIYTLCDNKRSLRASEKCTREKKSVNWQLPDTNV